MISQGWGQFDLFVFAGMNIAEEFYPFSETQEFPRFSVGKQGWSFPDFTSFATHSFGKCDRRCSQLGQTFARLIVTTIGPNMGFFLVIFILLVIQSSGMVPAMRVRALHLRITAHISVSIICS